MLWHLEFILTAPNPNGVGRSSKSLLATISNSHQSLNESVFKSAMRLLLGRLRSWRDDCSVLKAEARAEISGYSRLAITQSEFVPAENLMADMNQTQGLKPLTGSLGAGKTCSGRLACTPNPDQFLRAGRIIEGTRPGGRGFSMVCPRFGIRYPRKPCNTSR